MYNNGRLIICLEDLSYVQKRWSLDDIAVFEKVLILVRKKKRNDVTLCKKSIISELRIGRRTLDHSLSRLVSEGILVHLGGFRYSVGDIDIILNNYYINKDREAFRFKLNYYIPRRTGNFNIIKP